MARASRTGVRGLYCDKRTGRYSIDLRWHDPKTGEFQRHRERLPPETQAKVAKRRARGILASAMAGTFKPERKDGAPRQLFKALDEYVKWAKTNRPRTARDRESLAKVIRKHIGDCKLDELSPFHLERLKHRRLAEGRKPGTVNRAVQMLKHAAGLWAGWGWISPDRLGAIRAVKLLKEPPGRVRYLTDDERARLIAALTKPAFNSKGKPRHPSILPLVQAALLSGLRLEEVAGLEKSSVDLAARTITLTRTKNNRVRRVPINDDLAPILEAAMARSKTEHVFTSRLGRRYTGDGIHSCYVRAVAKAEIEDFTFHDLRHDFATQLRRGGAGLDVVAKLLGHSSLAMAQRYAHLGDDELTRAVATVAIGKPSNVISIAAKGRK